MHENYVMKLNENLLWFSVIMLILYSTFLNISYLTILIFWVIIVVSIGNAKRFYSKKHITLSIIIRRSIYVVPFFLPLLIGFKPDINTSNLMYWCLTGVLIGILFILPKIKEWRIALSKEMIEFSTKRKRIDYFTQITMLIGAAIGEEFFFRNFIIGFTEHSTYVFPIIASCFLFFLNHYGVKWNESFEFYDYIIQIIFGIVSAIIFIISKSIIPVIIAHLIYNSPLILLLFKSYVHHYYLSKTKNFFGNSSEKSN